MQVFWYSFRVSLKNFSPVFWRTTVHNWEVELYQDAVHNGASTLSTPTGLKRPAQDGDEHEEGRLPSKRLKTVRVGKCLCVCVCVCMCVRMYAHACLPTCRLTIKIRYNFKKIPRLSILTIISLHTQ